jgi:DNA invertase Pin-like site-specific DNA recombinase
LRPVPSQMADSRKQSARHLPRVSIAGVERKKENGQTAERHQHDYDAKTETGTKMTTAYGYLRVSSLGAVDGDGFPRQRLAIEAYALVNDIQITEWFADEGVPGTTELKNRQGLAACMARVETSGVKLVLVESADRLARDSLIAELIIREFQKAGVRLVAASGGVDLTAGDNTNPTAKLVRQILAAVAEFDRCVIVLKTRAARERIRGRGERCEGRKPYPRNQSEEIIFETLQRLADQGVSCLDIASKLNDDGIPTRQGKRWHSGTVSKILSRQRV